MNFVSFLTNLFSVTVISLNRPISEAFLSILMSIEEEEQFFESLKDQHHHQPEHEGESPPSRHEPVRVEVEGSSGSEGTAFELDRSAKVFVLLILLEVSPARFQSALRC
jgi:hypothetical protein